MFDDITAHHNHYTKFGLNHGEMSFYSVTGKKNVYVDFTVHGPQGERQPGELYHIYGPFIAY